MKKIIYVVLIIVLLILAGWWLADFSETPEKNYTGVNQQGLNLMNESEFLTSSTEGTMLMIEFHEDTMGLTNFVDLLNKKDIPGVLLVSPDYVEKHCETINKVRDMGVKLGAGVNSEAFWDKPYEEQYEAIKETKETVKECTGEELDMFNSRYFAYDENTIKAADELGIDYVFARGTTDKRATVYKPEEYDVKIFSVSNINSPEYGTGSLCDYSYWARGGTPEEFESKLFDALKYDQISPVSHTYLGGMKQKWNEPYINFLSEADVEWKTFEEITEEPDLVLPFSEIPQNREVQYKEPKPNTPLEETENVDNPCSAEELSETEESGTESAKEDQIVMFHNDEGSMCLKALEFFEENDYEVKEYITGDPDFSEKLSQFKAAHEGESVSFDYYPMIFIGEKAYSGFNEDIAQEIKEIME